jgi:N-methylhydantoinase A/oxoprolinase/acetone carboxylase beta subunit
MRIGVDSGGTFTDFVVLHDNGKLEVFKLRSNPRDPASVILAGLRRAAAPAHAALIHGSTVATNALLERKGARTALVTTAGFEDVIFIGRQCRAELYNLTPQPRRHLLPRELCFGLHERAHADGSIELRPTAAGLRRLRARLKREGVESIAICFLHAYQNPENEQIAAATLDGLAYLSASHDICPEFREYERTSTTLINAYVGPLMQRYLRDLERKARCRISILQSNGGSLSAQEASRHAVRTILSGPAGGVVGAGRLARRAGYARILGFDMGGTSTDVSLIDGAPTEASEGSIDGFPLRVPMLDIHTVGAGGGSIARVDEGGLLHVGPESAGADPGPACYGKGEDPTVTDAHVVLGRIAPDQLVSGELPLSPTRAQRAIDRIAKSLNLSRTATAAGILRAANASMERAIRVVSVERGHDPRRFALLAFGGCGGLHACEIAAELGIDTVLVPALAGVLSALGMLLASPVRDFAAASLGRPNVEPLFRSLETQARKSLPGATLSRTADLRYRGQSYEITIPWNPADPAAPFHRAHQALYGYSNPSQPTEIVAVRVRARLSAPQPRGPLYPPSDRTFQTSRRIFVSGKWRLTPVLSRTAVHSRPTPGPALIADYGATTLVPPAWRYRRGPEDTLILTRA